MSVYVVIEGSNQAQLDGRINVIRSVYLAKGINEKMGTPRYNGARTKAFFGTHHGTLAELSDLGVTHSPWASVTDDPIFMQDAEWVELAEDD